MAIDYGTSLTPVYTPRDLQSERAGVMQLLTTPAPVYTPELTSGVLDMISRRGKQRTNESVANLESDIMARGGTGSSTEYGGLATARALGDQAIADEELQFILGAADASAKNRQFNVGTGVDLYRTNVGQFEGAAGRKAISTENEIQRQFEAEQVAKYLAMLKKQNNKKGNIASGITGLVTGIGAGAMTGWNPTAMSAGANIGGQLGFLFA